jgi:hypothetical protein
MRRSLLIPLSLVIPQKRGITSDNKRIPFLGVTPCRGNPEPLSLVIPQKRGITSDSGIKSDLRMAFHH